MTTPPSPHDALRQQQRLMAIDLAIRGGDLAKAADLAEAAVAEGAEHPGLFNLLAMKRNGEGRLEEALDLLRRAERMAPNDINVLNAMGLCLGDLGRIEEAGRAFDRALALNPRFAAALYNKGSLMEAAGEMAEARRLLEAAVETQPVYPDATARLAWLCANRGDAKGARAFAERTLQAQPANPLARLSLAAAEVQEKAFAAAADRLAALRAEPGLSPRNQALAAALAGDALDGLGRPADAFEAYAASKALLQAQYADRFGDPVHSPLGHARRIAAWFRAAPVEPWTRSPPVRPRSGAPRTHVFLVGFPRSGTTLLENVLAAHPEVTALQERDFLVAANAGFMVNDPGLERLSRLDEAEAERWRDRYWSDLRAAGVEVTGKVFIDKMPLATVVQPLIAKLFPQARILVARRDPRDVVLSCFRRRIEMTQAMYQFVTLEGAAAHYGAVMALDALYAERLPLARHVIRYEDLVLDFETEITRAGAFLGLDYSPAMRHFAEAARARGSINTPSAAQVVRGLYNEGVGQWRRYADQLAPVQPLLAPWVERFGYS